jgi:hypothetical protein
LNDQNLPIYVHENITRNFTCCFYHLFSKIYLI